MRSWGYLVIVLGAVLLVGAVWWSLSVDDLSRGSMMAAVLIVPVTVIGVGVALRVAPLGGEGAVDSAAVRLIEKVRADREPFLRQALGVAWDQEPAHVRFTAPAPGEFSLAIESVLVHWQRLEGPDRMQGTMASIASFYRGVQADPSAAGRLMITGAGGAGKSVLASKLVVDLLASLPEKAGTEAVRIPVWLSLTGCRIDPEIPTAGLPDVFRTWLSREVSDVYGLRADLARSLVERHRILPVLDGLDELDPPRAVAIVNALNHGPRQPLILTCRTGDYSSLVAGELAEARRPVLMNATHITLRPLEPPAIDLFLTAALTPEKRSRWAKVIAAVHEKQPVAAVLSSPLRLSFAYRAFKDADNPEVLLSLTEKTAMAALVKPAITTMVNNDPKADSNGWTAPNVLRWLEYLALHQHDHTKGSPYDILLPDLWRLGGRLLPHWLLPAIAAVAAVICGSLWVVERSSPMVGIAVLMLGFSIVAALPISRVERIVDLRTPIGRAGLLRKLVVGAVIGLVYGLMFGPRPVVGLMVGLMVGLVFGLREEPGGTRNCSQLMAQALAYTLMCGLVSGLMFGLVAGLMFGPVPRLVIGLVIGLVLGLLSVLVFGNGSMWLRYLIGTTLAARRGVAPHRLATFLDWGLDVGLFRMSGYTLQFRHQDLYQALLTHAAVGISLEGPGRAVDRATLRKDTEPRHVVGVELGENFSTGDHDDHNLTQVALSREMGKDSPRPRRAVLNESAENSVHAADEQAAGQQPCSQSSKGDNR